MNGKCDSVSINNFDFSEHLNNSIKDARAVQERLRAIMEGVGKNDTSRAMEQGLADHSRVFQGLSRSYSSATARAARVTELIKKVPLDRLKNVSRSPPEDGVELAKHTQLLEFVNINWFACNKVVPFLNRGPLDFLMFQVQSIEQAQKIVLEIGERRVVLSGYFIALMLDIGGTFAPVGSQVRYFRDAFLRGEEEKLEEMRREASRVGKALMFCEFVKLANYAMEEQEKVLETAEQILSDFVSDTLPMTLDRLGV